MNANEIKLKNNSELVTILLLTVDGFESSSENVQLKESILGVKVMHLITWKLNTSQTKYRSVFNFLHANILPLGLLQQSLIKEHSLPPTPLCLCVVQPGHRALQSSDMQLCSGYIIIHSCLLQRPESLCGAD